MSRNALVGATGFVGSTLLRQTSFEGLYSSTNISEIQGKEFETVVCAGAPAQKWKANLHPEADQENLNSLMAYLSTIRCDRFVLISTVDVFGRPIGVNEDSEINETELTPYGRHRRNLESFVAARFEQHLIIRLPGLVGPGLRKNVLFDIAHHHHLGDLDTRSEYQFYPMVNLWPDIQTATRLGLELVHFTAEPVSVGEVAVECFGERIEQVLPKEPPKYDFQTLHALKFGGHNGYQYSKRESTLAIRAYAQSVLVEKIK